MTWYHWSSSGQLVSDPLHAGTEISALQRRDDLAKIPWDASDLADNVPRYWCQGEHSRLYLLDLTEPLVNPGHPVMDHEVYDHPDVPVLYVNGFEQAGELSVVAPLRCWTVVEARRLTCQPTPSGLWKG